jgi:benzoyl-CoA reductase/2-hydroxyglutaryl-CoA dehydratase subunit BcrC/BadD/HgdB
VIERIPDRKEVAARMKQEGRRIAAVLPIHYPRALLRAHGYHPMEVWGPPRVRSSEGDRHFQSYTCAIVRNATSFLLEGGLDVADVILVPHTCDALQGMASVLKDFIRPRQPVLTLYHPRARRASDLLFYVDELQRLAGALQSLSGSKPSDEDWLEAIRIESEADAALSSLYSDRTRLAVTDREFYSVVRAREYLPAEDFTALANAIRRDGAAAPTGVPIMISGIVIEPMELLDRLAEIGGRIAADDLACGYRRVYPRVESGPPLERIARSLLDAPPDPTRGTPIAERATDLIHRMRESGAKGLLMYDVKFCEPELFDVPRLRRRLADAGYPMIHVEHELGGSLAQQTLTRIEAFVETLR